MRSMLATDVPPNFMTRKDIRRVRGPTASTALRQDDPAATARSWAGGGVHIATGPRLRNMQGRLDREAARRANGGMATLDEPAGAATLDPAEVDRFTRFASEWWDAGGKFRTLHRIGPARLTFLRDGMVRHFGGRGGRTRPLAGLTVLDIGCGGGLVCEPLARLGASVTGIDPAPDNIEAARRHAAGQGLE